MHKNPPQAMLHNYFYGPPAGSIKIAQLCKISALPTLFATASAHALGLHNHYFVSHRTEFAQKNLHKKTSSEKILLYFFACFLDATRSNYLVYDNQSAFLIIFELWKNYVKS